MGGVVTVCQASSCMASQGYGNDMNGISAVILGGISMAGGRGNVFGTLIGVAILSTLVNGMTLLNVTPTGSRSFRVLFLYLQSLSTQFVLPREQINFQNLSFFFDMFGILN